MSTATQMRPPLDCGGRKLDLSRPVVMGVINTTPDSFSDGGTLYRNRQLAIPQVLQRAGEMVQQGARIVDIGGESTRPGAAPVSEQQELERVIPAVQAIAAELDVVISVDTSTPAVMAAAAEAGAGLINDVRALTRPGALQTAQQTGLPVCLMHMQGEPGSMQQSPSYEDVVRQVFGFLQERVACCEAVGIPRQRLVLDPGFGFGKTLQHNLQLLRRLGDFSQLGLPLLVGLSRKSMIGQLLAREVDQRLPASLALAVLAAERGASIIRCHDVAATADALAMVSAINDEGY